MSLDDFIKKPAKKKDEKKVKNPSKKPRKIPALKPKSQKVKGLVPVSKKKPNQPRKIPIKDYKPKPNDIVWKCRDCNKRFVDPNYSFGLFEVVKCPACGSVKTDKTWDSIEDLENGD